MSRIQMPACTSCGRFIQPGDQAVHFTCPNCGEVVIWRCGKCRKFGNTYRCAKCSFTGP
ncbi:MAG: zinc finger domain-containing protein [Candidatus Atabeyarchaeum deiterrae]